ncbi:MAG: polysaccharide deacetylase family protein [Polyangiales bacterium]
MRWSLSLPSLLAATVGALAVITPAMGTVTRTLGEQEPRRVRLRTLRDGQLIEGSCPARYPRCLSFTFDDGPEWSTTPRLLDMLDARHIRATFFVVGHRISGPENHHRLNRGVLRDIARRGHRIGNHTFRHVVLDGLRPERIAREIDDTAEIITRETGRRPWLLRAPFGALASDRALKAVFSRRYTPVYWQLDTEDWSVNSARAVLLNFRRVLDESPRGGVVLMHDTRPWSVAAFPLILNEIDQRNARLVAQGQAPYRIVGLEHFWRPMGRRELPRGLPLPRRPRSGVRPAPR